MIGVTAHVSGTFDAAEVRRATDMKARQAVTAGAKAGGAFAAASARRKSGRMSAIYVQPPFPTKLGVAAAFVSPARHAWYQNDGTLGNRRPRARRSGPSVKARTPGTGIKPSFFLFHGLSAGKVAMGRVLGVSMRR